MSDSLATPQLNELEQKLRRRFEELREDIRDELQQSGDEQYQQIAGQVHDSGDESVADLLTDINLAVLDSRIREIRRVEAALQRLANSDYGDCQDCGEPIALERLQVEPDAMRCVACQTVHDRLYAES